MMTTTRGEDVSSAKVADHLARCPALNYRQAPNVVAQEARDRVVKRLIWICDDGLRGPRGQDSERSVVGAVEGSNDIAARNDSSQTTGFIGQERSLVGRKVTVSVSQTRSKFGK